MLKNRDTQMLEDIQKNLHEYRTNELDAWRRQVAEHPYRSREISEAVLRMLTKEIRKREHYGQKTKNR